MTEIKGNKEITVSNTNIENWHIQVQKSIDLNRDFNHTWLYLVIGVRYRNSKVKILQQYCNILSSLKKNQISTWKLDNVQVHELNYGNIFELNLVQCKSI